MLFKVLINDAVKKFLLRMDEKQRRQARRAFEYLENGLWDGGLRVKKLRGISNKTIFEGKVNPDERLLFTLGEEISQQAESKCRLIHVWGIVTHDEISKKAASIIPEDAPFLRFEAFQAHETQDVDLESLDPAWVTQEPIEERINYECGAQRWFILDENEWRRFLLYSQGDFEIFLYLTCEQKELLQKRPPIFVSGTAGSGKTTLAIYYLLHPSLVNAEKLFLTYNAYLRNFSERLYRGLIACTEQTHVTIPEFYTFKELCMRLIPGALECFRAEREVDTFSFRDLFRLNPLSDRYDASLVWEEIRSIIKGAKPQMDASTTRGLLKMIELGNWDDSFITQLREHLLAFQNLSIYEKANQMVQRLMGISLEECARNLEEILNKRADSLKRIFDSFINLLEKYEADFRSPLMTLAEYERLGRKRAPAFVHERSEIYKIAQWYQERLRSERRWDEIDLTRAAIRVLDEGTHLMPKYDLVCCDEVQDFTDVQLSLLIRLPRDPKNIFLAGDPKQIVNPSGFRWEEAKKLFYARNLPVPQVHHLTLNFRCTGSIVLLANAILQIKQQLLGIYSDEKLDDWKFQGKPPFVIKGLSENEFLQYIQMTAADQTILTRTGADRDFLKEKLKTELVFTIKEAKGLEFKTVLLWKFCSDPYIGDLWSRILSFKTAKIHEAHIRHELNLLYVGITRAQHNLIFYDGLEASVIWLSPYIKDLIFRTHDITSLEQAWKKVSTPEEWKQQGDYFMDHEHYRAAAECYRNADHLQGMYRALAMDGERKGDFLMAAENWRNIDELLKAAEAFEKASQWEKALNLWEQLGIAEKAWDCRIYLLERDKKYTEIALMLEQAHRFEDAKLYWKKAGRNDQLARICEFLNQTHEAAQAYQDCSEFEKAAHLWLKSNHLEAAAQCFESTHLFEEALKIWKKLERREGLLQCLIKIKDPIRLAEFYEEQEDWSKAIEYYQQAWGPNLKSKFKLEIQNLKSQQGNDARLAIRWSLLKQYEEAAQAWQQARNLEMAAINYQKIQNYYAAGQCYEKINQWTTAIEMYIQCETERLSHFRNVRRCAIKLKMKDQWGQTKHLQNLASQLYQKEFFPAVAALYSILKQKRLKSKDLSSKSAKLNFLYKDPQISKWMKKYDYQAIAHHFIQSGQFQKGSQSFLSILKHSSLPLHVWRNFSHAFEELLKPWIQKDGSERNQKRIAKIVRENHHIFPYEFIAEILGPFEEYDRIYQAGLKELTTLKDKNSYEAFYDRCIQLARQKEEMGNWADAGVRYLILGLEQEAKRCWLHVEPDERNLQCLEDADLWKKVVEYYVGRKKYTQASEVSLSRQHSELAIEVYIQSNQPQKAARLRNSLKKMGLF